MTPDASALTPREREAVREYMSHILARMERKLHGARWSAHERAYRAAVREIKAEIEAITTTTSEGE